MRTFLLIPACFFVISLFSQNTFLESVGTNQEDLIYSVIEIKDGFVGTGHSESFSNADQAISLYKIDFNGQLIWARKINSVNNYGSGLAIVKTHDGGFAITGTVGSDMFGGQMCILKFNENGLLQWTKQYDEGSGSNGRRIVQTDDNGFLLAGGYDSSGSFGYLIKIDSAGNLKWSKKFPDVSNFYDFKKTSDNNYLLLAGEAIIKIDAAGNILWSKTYDEYGLDMLPITDGGCLIMGYYSGNGFILKLDPLGNLVWSKQVNNEVYIEFYTAIETRAKDFVLMGRRIDEDNNYHHNLIKINSSGRLIWTKDFPGAYIFGGLNDVIGTSDNGYLAVGVSAHEETGTFIKFDSEFNICEPTESIGSLQDFKVSYKNTTISAVSGNAVTYTRPVTISSAGSATNICSALPVDLVGFNATLQNNSVIVHWKTVTEANTSYFNIQRSTNGVSFSNIARVTAAGNSNSARNYVFSDLNIEDVISAKTVYYRLQTVDKDGSFALSKVVSVNMNAKTITLFLRPNPVKNKLSARIINYTGNADVRIYDVAGKQLYNKIVAVDNADIIISTATLKAGTYLLQINGGRLTLRQKFVKE